MTKGINVQEIFLGIWMLLISFSITILGSEWLARNRISNRLVLYIFAGVIVLQTIMVVLYWLYSTFKEDKFKQRRIDELQRELGKEG